MSLHPSEPDVKPPSWLLQNDIEFVRVQDSGRGNATVTVLAPGFGVCTVHHDDEVSTNAGTGHPARRQVTSLTLTLSNGTLGARRGLSRLLELVGAPLTYLAIQAQSCDGPMRVDDLLKWCPRLEMLVVHGTAIETQSLVQACRDNNIHLTQLLCDFDDVPLLAAELENPSARLARSLRHLSIATRTRWASEHMTLIGSV